MDNSLTAEEALLQILLLDGTGYGLSFIERVKELTEGKIRLHQGTVYPALREMERKGLVSTFESEPLPERGGRPRIYYKLTKRGQKAAEERALKGFTEASSWMSKIGRPLKLVSA